YYLVLDSLILYFYLFFFHCSRPHRDLHSFPTRRSSDLLVHQVDLLEQLLDGLGPHVGLKRVPVLLAGLAELVLGQEQYGDAFERSEEHTSELQSRFDLVCRLLLEKKK